MQEYPRHSDSKMSISDCQKKLRDIYLEKDSVRGVDASFMYFISEVGELAEAIREGENVEKEFADCAAWLLSVANLVGIDIEMCMNKYYLTCPNCNEVPCTCCSKP